MNARGSRIEVVSALKRVGQLESTDLKTLLADVKNMRREKWDWALPEALLMKSFASISLDIDTAIAFAEKLSNNASASTGT